MEKTRSTELSTDIHTCAMSYVHTQTRESMQQEGGVSLPEVITFRKEALTIALTLRP